MDSPISGNSTRHTDLAKRVSKVLAPAIAGKSCPICLSHLDRRRAAVITACHHAFCIECIRKWSRIKRACPLCNSHFDSWFFSICLSSGTFLKERLRAVAVVPKLKPPSPQRVIQRVRGELCVINGRSRSLPQRRSFGQPGSVHPHVIAERVLEWRVSIYRRHLQAVPLSPQNCLEQNILRNTGVKERVLRRIEPWIRRELQAMLGDPDPSIIVHVVTSLFISELEKKSNILSVRHDCEDDHLSPLRPFLHEWTNMFWHELRCFAESSFTIETYDSVVQYRQMD